jgi:uncharacterized protein YcbK (DUF882 family)
MDMEFMYLLQKMRDKFGKPMIITSGYRSEMHNQKIKGAKDSPHKLGKAVDIRCYSSKTRYELVKAAMELGLRIGIYDKHLHFDNVGEPIIWLGVSQ